MKSKKELPKAVSYGDRETMLKAIGEKMKETRKARAFATMKPLLMKMICHGHNMADMKEDRI
jgi:hypothetical protein